MRSAAPRLFHTRRTLPTFGRPTMPACSELTMVVLRRDARAACQCGHISSMRCGACGGHRRRRQPPALLFLLGRLQALRRCQSGPLVAASLNCSLPAHLKPLLSRGPAARGLRAASTLPLQSAACDDDSARCMRASAARECAHCIALLPAAAAAANGRVLLPPALLYPVMPRTTLVRLARPLSEFTVCQAAKSTASKRTEWRVPSATAASSSESSRSSSTSVKHHHQQ